MGKDAEPLEPGYLHGDKAGKYVYIKQAKFVSSLAISAKQHATRGTHKHAKSAKT